MTAFVCFAKCWGCQFDSHYDEPTPHTWMDADDVECRGISFDREALAVSHPCACRCGGGQGGCRSIGGTS